MMLKQYKVKIRVFFLALLVSFSLWLSHSLMLAGSSAQAHLFDAVWETVEENFYDSNFNGVDWDAMKMQYRPKVNQAKSPTEKAAIINQMLAELNTSHTHLYTADEPAYYQLLGIFYPKSTDIQNQLKETFPDGKLTYSGIGIATEQTDDKTFIRAIFDGSPAEASDLQVGDRILSADGQPFAPIRSFSNKDKPVNLQLQISPDPSSQKEIEIEPASFDGLTMFLDAMEESIEIIEQSGKQIGYVRIWSYAGGQYQELLEEELMFGKLKDADALVMDLREGWGGAPPTALHIFTARGPSVTMSGRNRWESTYQSQWDKPVVMLINEGSRSAKEMLAYSFKKYEIGPVVGSKTAGAVTGGTAFIMPDKSLLYVAVSDVHLDGTVRLEGLGVAPDIEVPFEVEYAQGADPQKERAIAVAVEKLN